MTQPIDTVAQKKRLVYDEPATNKFDAFLRKELSFEVYTKLHEHLLSGCTQYHATSIKNDPSTIITAEVEMIAKLTGKPMQLVWNIIKESETLK